MFYALAINNNNNIIFPWIVLNWELSHVIVHVGWLQKLQYDKKYLQNIMGKNHIDQMLYDSS